MHGSMHLHFRAQCVHVSLLICWYFGSSKYQHLHHTHVRTYGFRIMYRWSSYANQHAYVCMRAFTQDTHVLSCHVYVRTSALMRTHTHTNVYALHAHAYLDIRHEISCYACRVRVTVWMKFRPISHSKLDVCFEVCTSCSMDEKIFHQY
jgi:hypothetical protein